MSCLLKLKRVKKSSNEGKKAYSDRRKNDFANMISKPLEYKGLPVYFNKHNEGIEKCYSKFIVGNEMFHSTKQPDFRRLERLEWIYEIIEKADECGTCYEFREGIERGKNLIYCVDKQYLIVLKKEHSHYVIITAYSVSNDKKQQQKYLNMHL